MTDRTADRDDRTAAGDRRQPLIKVKQQRIDEDVFMEKRKEVLAIWPTGKDVDLEEAVAYQKALPDSRALPQDPADASTKRGKLTLFPRQGTPLVDDEIALIRSLNDLGIYLLPFTTDSYTRNLQLDKVERGLQESLRTGKPALNGYPIINHGVKTNRKVVEATRRAPSTRARPASAKGWSPRSPSPRA